MRRVPQLLSSLGQAFQALHVIRAPFIVSVLAVFALTVPDQTREVYRIMAEDYVQETANSRVLPIVRVWLTFMFVVLAAVAIWITTRDIAIMSNTRGAHKSDVPPKKVLWLPALCAISIPCGVALGLLWAANDANLQRLPETALELIPDLRPIQNTLVKTAALLQIGVWIGLALAISCLLLILFLERNLARSRETSPSSGLSALGTRTIVLVSIGVLITAITVAWPIKFSQLIGSISVFLVFISVLVTVAGALTAYFDRYRIPALTILLVVAAFLAAFDLNDNHLIRPIPINETEVGQVNVAWDGTPPASFESWYKSRADLDHYGDKPYPVFIVAAAGGGLYAAQHAATVLARIQDRCPSFAQHVFAISGVSGGTLGAATFTSLARRYADNGPWQKCQVNPGPAKGQFESRAEQVLRNDFLSPAVAATLFPDFVQRFLPVPVGQFDRARVLEASIEQAWEQMAPDGQNPFTETFLKQWRPDGAAPALLVNATDVNGGQRIVIAPFLFHGHQWILETIAGQFGYRPLAHLHQIAGWQTWWIEWTAPEWIGDPRGYPFRLGPVNADLKLSTAVSLSARFPWFSPAGSIERRDGPLAGSKVLLVDGGYFENSGIETAMDLINALNRYETQERANQAGFRGPVRITLLIIGTDQSVLVQPRSGVSELLSPIRAMLSSREERGHLAAYRSYSRVKCYPDIIPYCDNGTVIPVNLNEDAFKLPLGWQLSQATRDVIDIFSGYPDRYDSKGYDNRMAKDKGERMKAYVHAADKAGCLVHSILSGQAGDKEVSLECDR